MKDSSLSPSRTIAFVSDAIYPYNKGGKETRLFQISTRLAKMGFDVHIYTMQWWKGGKTKEENGVHLHAICPLLPLYDGPRRSIKQGIIFGLSCFKLLFADFDFVDVDHMPFFPLYSMRIVCWLKGKELIGTWNEVWGEIYWKKYLPGFKGTIAWWIERISIRLPDTIISISPHTTQKLAEVFRIDTKKLVYVPCGYDSESIESASASKDKSDVIYVGRLLEHKNVKVLIDAIDLLKKEKPNVICRIIGVGPEEQRLKDQVKSLKLQKNIIFHGELEKHSDVYGLMKASKVFVLPSTREGFGIVVLEANACGVPVITINHPENAAKNLIISGSNGYVSSLGSEKLNKIISQCLFKGIKGVKTSGNSWNEITKIYLTKFILKSSQV